jgi:GNAT superfamily N-acetyltransferase
MNIPNGFFDIPRGKIAAVVTYFQMCQHPPARPEPSEVPWSLEKTEFPNLQDYRALFRRIGQEWLWFSRLQLNDVELGEILNHPLYETYVFNASGDMRGLVEFDFRVEGECEISFFGLTSEMIGQGAGRWMMNRALQIAWSRSIRRLWLHTCTFDHPSAVDFYIRSGFAPYRRQIEVADDPRTTGLLSTSAAPHVPLI